MSTPSSTSSSSYVTSTASSATTPSGVSPPPPAAPVRSTGPRRKGVKYYVPPPWIPEDARVNTKNERKVLAMLYGFLTVGQTFVLHYMMRETIPYPLTITWFQLFIGLMSSIVAGEFGLEFEKFQVIIPARLDAATFIQLVPSSVVFIAMISAANLCLARVYSLAVYPVLLGLGVAIHHITRTISTGERYSLARWISVATMVFAAVILSFGTQDPVGVGNYIGWALFYATVAAIYRTFFQSRAFHLANGMGSRVHMAHAILGVIVLPFLIAKCPFENNFLQFMPRDIIKRPKGLFPWGCLVTAAIFPFARNIVSNRLLRLGGHKLFRKAELASVLLTFILGCLIFDKIGLAGVVAFACFFSGRALNSLDYILHLESQQEATIKSMEDPLESQAIADAKAFDFHALLDEEEMRPHDNESYKTRLAGTPDSITSADSAVLDRGDYGQTYMYSKKLPRYQKTQVHTAVDSSI